MNKIQNNIKKIKLIIENSDIFWKKIEEHNIDEDKINFLKDCINLEVQDKVDLCDIFYLDKYQFQPQFRKGYNFYDYSQKLTIDDLKKLKKMKFKNFEINYFNYDLNGIKNNVVVKKGTKLNIKNYYESLQKKKIIISKKDNYIFFKYYPKYDSFTEIDFYDLVEKIKMFWKKYNIWVNSINYYSLRKNNYFYDPDMFYTKVNIVNAFNLNIKNNEFEFYYKKYKLRNKTIVYKIKYFLDKNAINFLYNSYHILETLARTFK